MTLNCNHKQLNNKEFQMPRYNLAPEQQQQLIVDLQDAGQRILALTFPSKETDEQVIRHHAYLRGGFDFIKQMLEDKTPEATQEGA